MKTEDVERYFDDNKPNKVKVAITDIDGILRGKYIHVDKFRSAMHKNLGFCNVVFGWDCHDELYTNTQYTGWHSGYPDAQANIDLSTFRRVPWDNKIPFFLADFSHQQTSPLPICPRQTLKKVINYANSLGYTIKTGCEFEWFNFKENSESITQKNFEEFRCLTPGMFGYSLLRASANSDFFNDLFDQLLAFDIPLEGLHTETGPGVYEAAILAADALSTGDRAVLFKTSVKEIARKHDIVASFMARWNTKLPGCSGHIHQSLLDSNNEPVFYDDTRKHNISKTFEYYLAGQIKYLADFLVMMAPTVNSYKRLTEGFWAPTVANWGLDNRTCALRVLNESRQSTRVEVRVPGADMNPYLALAASIGAGLYGIEQQLPLMQAPTTGNGYQDKNNKRFASNLKESTQNFAKSSAANKIFGEEFVSHFCATRYWEWQQSQKAVSDWEIKRYFEII